MMFANGEEDFVDIRHFRPICGQLAVIGLLTGCAVAAEPSYGQDVGPAVALGADGYCDGTWYPNGVCYPGYPYGYGYGPGVGYGYGYGYGGAFISGRGGYGRAYGGGGAYGHGAVAGAPRGGFRGGGGAVGGGRGGGGHGGGGHGGGGHGGGGHGGGGHR